MLSNAIDSRGNAIFDLLTTYYGFDAHPSVEEDLSLKIEVHDQTIWKSTPELYLICSIQMKSKSVGHLSQKSTRWHWP